MCTSNDATNYEIYKKYDKNIKCHKESVVNLQAMLDIFIKISKNTLPLTEELIMHYNFCKMQFINPNLLYLQILIKLLKDLCDYWEEFKKNENSSNYDIIKNIIDGWNKNLKQFLNIINPESLFNNLLYIYFDTEFFTIYLLKDIPHYIISKHFTIVNKTTKLIKSIASKLKSKAKLNFGRFIIGEIDKITEPNQLIIYSPEKMNILRENNFYSWVKLMFSNFENYENSNYIFGLKFQLPKSLKETSMETSMETSETMIETSEMSTEHLPYIYSNTLEIIKLFFGGSLPLNAEFNSPSSFIGNLLNFPTEEKYFKYGLFYEYARIMNKKILELIKKKKYCELGVVECHNCQTERITKKISFLTFEISCPECGAFF